MIQGNTEEDQVVFMKLLTKKNSRSGSSNFNSKTDAGKVLSYGETKVFKESYKKLLFLFDFSFITKKSFNFI